MTSGSYRDRELLSYRKKKIEIAIAVIRTKRRNEKILVYWERNVKILSIYD